MPETRLSPFVSTRSARRFDLRRLMQVTTFLLGAVVLLAGVTAIGLWQYAERRIEHHQVPALDPTAPGPPEAPLPPLPGVLNVLVVGSDSREGLTEEQLLQLGTEEIAGSRADTIMLVHLSPERDHAVVVSFPRDLKVELPGLGTDRINHALDLGGPDLLVRTVQDYTGLRLDHYVEVNIAGFIQVVDVLGGVELCLDEPLVDEYAAADIPAGCSVLDGRDASAFVRARMFDPRGDLGRIERQQHFVRSAMAQVTSARTLVDPVRLKRLIDVVADSVVTDERLSAWRMFRIGRALAAFDPEEVVMRTVPAYYEPPFMHAHVEQAEALFQALRDGSALPALTDAETEVVPELQPADVRLLVLNGAGVEGLAARARGHLESAGFVVVDVGNAEHFGFDVSEVRYPAGYLPHAELVARSFPSAVLVEREDLPDGVDVVLVVGRNWSEGG